MLRFKNISEAWAFIYGKAFPPNVHPRQKYETEKAFMSGALAMFEILVATSEGEENKAADELEKIHADLLFRVEALK